jgi:hypothetical protein
VSNGRKRSTWLKERIPRLTVKGLIVQCVNNLANTPRQKFDWADALVDAAIISGLAFFSTLGGGSVAGLEGLATLKAAAIAGCAQFFIFLALKRGIVQSNQV